jgi:hypothetical protein
MAHVAKIDEEGIVQEVHVINNYDLPDNGEFSLKVEEAANKFQHDLGLAGIWKLTSYNGNFRGVYGEVGYKYDKDKDKFSPIQN